jgi:hypothetical protein
MCFTADGTFAVLSGAERPTLGGQRHFCPGSAMTLTALRVALPVLA